MNRRRFFIRAARLVLASLACATKHSGVPMAADDVSQRKSLLSATHTNQPMQSVTIFLSGDVMTGRGIDQILPHPSRPHLFESYVRSALGYVELAERASGSIPRPVHFPYIWGEALGELERVQPDVRIVNLETSVTLSEDAWPDKGIHYRMHPANVPCLTAAKLDCCILANNHVLDWGRSGLVETLDTLHKNQIRTAGAGRDEDEASAPAALNLPGPGRVLVFAFATTDSGVPQDWSAGRGRPGVNFLEDLSGQRVAAIARSVDVHKCAGDVAIASIHWGGNWGFTIPAGQRVFAHRLIDAAGIDLVHGHSSHHVKGIEVYRGKLILYGCGDFLNDYEGIDGYEDYRDDLSLMYFATLDRASGLLLGLRMKPTQTRRFRVDRAPEEGLVWLSKTLNREGGKLGTRLDRQPDAAFLLRWS